MTTRLFDTGIFDSGIFKTDEPIPGIFEAPPFDTGIFDHRVTTTTSAPAAGGSWAWLDAFSPRRRQEAPTEAPKPKRKKRKRLKADTIDLAPDGPVEVQTGIVEAVPVWDVLAELQRIQNEAAEARRQRLRAIALADDEWLMMQ
jgi:hypothetical protein